MSPQLKRKDLLETLISAQELIVAYSRGEVFNHIMWGVLFFAIAVLPPYNFIYLNIILLVLSGIRFHSAVKEHQFYKRFKEDLEDLRTINPEEEKEEIV